jgi:hypothetical protein
VRSWHGRLALADRAHLPGRGFSRSRFLFCVSFWLLRFSALALRGFFVFLFFVFLSVLINVLTF